MNRIHPAAEGKRSAHAFIVLMGIVALFGDMTYEGARGLVGPYLAFLGASAPAVGFAAGLGEFLGYGLRVVTGRLADRTRAYWLFVVAGYSVNLIAVPGLALVGSWQAAACLLVLERVGKGIRSPARGALLSHAATEVGVGKGFGIEEALDQVGAVTGPLLTALAIWVVRGESVSVQYKAAFSILLLPVVLNLAFVLRARAAFPNPGSMEGAKPEGQPPLRGLFAFYVAGAMLMAIGFSDWALVAYHANRAGILEAGILPLLYAGIMAVDAIVALVSGLLFDRFGVIVLAVTTAISAACAPLVFMGSSLIGLLIGAACWGIGMGAQDSVFKAVIALLVPKAERARAYGFFFALFGLAWWLGSLVMGFLYERSRIALVAFSLLTQLGAVPVLLHVGRRIQGERAQR